MRWVGFCLLILMLPLALYAAGRPINEYVAQGRGGIDCEGPERILMFGLPTLFIYATAAVVNAWKWLRPLNCIVAVLCLLICVGIARNLDAAFQAKQENAGLASCA